MTVCLWVEFQPLYLPLTEFHSECLQGIVYHNFDVYAQLLHTAVILGEGHRLEYQFGIYIIGPDDKLVSQLVHGKNGRWKQV